MKGESPAGLQKREEEIRNDIMEKVMSENPGCHLAIKGIIRRERLSLHLSRSVSDLQ